MALIAMAVHDTEENKRSELTDQTLETLRKTVNFEHHRLIVIDNASCKETRTLLHTWRHRLPEMKVITLPKNIGTAKAINLAWKERVKNENAVKMDNDVHIVQRNWADTMEEAIRRDPKIGIIGLKRKDLAECPDSENEWYVSTLHMLPHEPGERWIIVEKVQHVMGTCQMYSGALLYNIGYLYQMDGLYGFDDSLASLRSNMAGFNTVFLHGFEIDHLFNGATPYTDWKHKYAGLMMDKYHKVAEEYRNGTRSLYYPGP